jgi:hypothetical protein
MPTPSNGFVNSIRAYDPMLNVRWGPYIGRWVIERKSVISETELWFLKRRVERFYNWSRDPKRSLSERTKHAEQLREVNEELQSAESGHRVVLMPRELNTLAFNVLAMMDIKRWGGYSRMADELERMESRKEADQDRQMANERQAVAKQTYDVLDFLWRKRSHELASGSYRSKSLKELLNTSEV